MNKKLNRILVFANIIAISICCYLISNKPSKIEPSHLECKENLKPKKIIYFEQFDEENFTCTGMTYDKKKNVIWIADYGAVDTLQEKKSPRLVAVNTNFSKVQKIINLEEKVTQSSNIQGIAYDTNEHIIWVATGETIIAVKSDGNIQYEIRNDRYYNEVANGIAYDEENDSLWILCYEKYLITIDKQGEVLSKYKINIKDQDMIYIYGNQILLTAGADYDGENNYVVCLNKYTGSIETLYRTIDSYAIEGLCVFNGKMYICNDGAYHNAQIDSSYIVEYSWIE